MLFLSIHFALFIQSLISALEIDSGGGNLQTPERRSSFENHAACSNSLSFNFISFVVAVALNYAEIMNLGGSDPVSLGTISGIQIRGKGSNNDIAKNNAIALASKEAGKRIVALINSKGLN